MSVMLGLRDLADANPGEGAGRHGLESVTSGRVIFNMEIRYGAVQGPWCREHGAMNAVNPERTIYRCLTCHEAAWAVRI